MQVVLLTSMVQFLCLRAPLTRSYNFSSKTCMCLRDETSYQLLLISLISAQAEKESISRQVIIVLLQDKGKFAVQLSLSYLFSQLECQHT